ncbi:hypothetical protein [Nonomuraea endophytica]|uniref:Uncharacterized protein n=1 Tax=Nonomuraea endophytica TaxID=714136 RepID=A0A7W8EJV1_9ACTN|nr:hypothetical protein [Nonomuraea endophytica]MBB5082044.1 hypothetical protein [Nonomuraea endophytica]
MPVLPRRAGGSSTRMPGRAPTMPAARAERPRPLPAEIEYGE